MDHGGGLRRDRRLRGRGPLPPVTGAAGHHRPGRPRPGGAHNLLRQNYYPEDEGRFKSQALADRLARAYGVPSATRSTSSGTRTPAPMDTAIPAFPPTAALAENLGLPAHRLRRQRRRAAGHGREPAGRPPPVAHRRGQRRRRDFLGRTRLRVFDGGSSPKPI